jgi:hypothetical protein
MNKDTVFLLIFAVLFAVFWLFAVPATLILYFTYGALEREIKHCGI